MLPWVLFTCCCLVFIAGTGRLLVCTGHHMASAGWRGIAIAVLPPLLLIAVALMAVRPYVGGNLVGAGDSHHYALQVADYTTQSRRGVLPVIIGQSEYAFNGNVHTVRTAPYFTHLAGLLDLLTLRQLGFVTLQNLTAAVTSALAALAAYFAGLRLSGGKRLASFLLAAIYVLSPATSGLLILQDMFATYMAVPWLMLCWSGLAGVLEKEDDRQDQLLAAGALGLTWLAHPPVAGWLTLMWGLVQIMRIGFSGGRWSQWRTFLMAGLLLAALSTYVFHSVAQLGFRPTPPVAYHEYASTWSRLGAALRQEFTPLWAAPAQATLRLGGAGLLLGCLSAVVFAWRRQWAGLLLTGLLVLGIVCLLPVPGVSQFLWQQLPERLATLSTWPAQRLAPLLTAGTLVAVAWAVRALMLRPVRGAYGAACLLLGAATAWTATENLTIQGRPGYARLAPERYQPLFSPQRLRLTRYSYDLFERMPGYFSHGWMDPEHESRLFDRAFDLQDNAPVIQALADAEEAVPVAPQILRDLAGPARYLLAFSFADPQTAGEIGIHAGNIVRTYALADSGGPLAFGARPHQGKTIPLHLPESGTHPVTVTSTATGVSVRFLRVSRESLSVRLHGHTPFAATVNAPEAGFLESPRVFIPGYEATVNGQRTPVRRSAENLVTVPVPSGRSEVVIAYLGPPFLRLTWFLAVGAIAMWPWLLLRAPHPSPAAGAWPDWVRRCHLGVGLAAAWCQRPRAVIVCVATLVLLIAGGLSGARFWQGHRAYGSLRLTLEIGRPALPRSEPIVTTGRPGAADCLYILYEENGSIRLGVDHWGAGGPVSEPIRLDFSVPHQLELTMGSLYPAAGWFSRPGPPGSDGQGRALLQVLLDGRKIFDQVHPFHAAQPSEVALGRNPVGSSVAGDSFSGQILSSERFTPTTERLPVLPGPP